MINIEVRKIESAYITSRINVEYVKELDEIAIEIGLTRSAMIRMILTKYLDLRRNDKTHLIMDFLSFIKEAATIEEMVHAQLKDDSSTEQ